LVTKKIVASQSAFIKSTQELWDGSVSVRVFDLFYPTP